MLDAMLHNTSSVLRQVALGIGRGGMPGKRAHWETKPGASCRHVRAPKVCALLARWKTRAAAVCRWERGWGLGCGHATGAPGMAGGPSGFACMHTRTTTAGSCSAHPRRRLCRWAGGLMLSLGHVVSHMKKHCHLRGGARSSTTTLPCQNALKLPCLVIPHDVKLCC